MADPVLEREDEDSDDRDPLLRRDKLLGLWPTTDVLGLGPAERSPI